MTMASLNFRTEWTDDKTAALRLLYWRGESRTRIATILGVTIDSVRRKCTRMGFRRDPMLVSLPPLPMTERKEVKHPKREPAPRLRHNGSIITVANVASGECRWIADAPSAQAQMCGHPISRGAYCKDHYKRAHDS